MQTYSKKKQPTNDRDALITFLKVQRELAVRKARRDFWTFCRLLYPDFYQTDRAYLKDFCESLQAFYERRMTEDILIVNMPPRHGKTFTVKNFILWVFGNNPRRKIISASYNQILSSLFAQQTRDGIMQEDENAKRVYFGEIFPETRIKYGDAAKGFWSLEGSEEKNYLATSPGGTSTGIGAEIVAVDDIIKSAAEAFNANVLDAHWQWYNNTIVQRMERPRLQIIVMTRWSDDDLAGKLIATRPEQVHLIEYKAIQEDGSMLCDAIMTREEYDRITQEMDPAIASANYQQEPINRAGRLYSGFKTYDKLPDTFDRIASYTDTADTGGDYLASYIYGEKNKEAYILDVIYTKEPQEVTEPLLAQKLHQHRVNVAYIESNNGGRAYGRNVQRILWEQLRSNLTSFDLFHQSQNKQSRILSNSAWVQEHIYFPENWHNRWTDLHRDLTTYQREGKNKNDDAQDAITGIAEKINTAGWLI